MAKFFPENPNFKNNIGEEKVFDYLKSCLNREEICYHNYDVKINEFDFCIMVPHHGILIIEVKSWKLNNILEVVDNEFVKYNVQGKIKYFQSPHKQVKNYTNNLIDQLGSRLHKDIFVLPLVWYTEMSKEDYYNKRLDILSPEKFTLFKEDLNNDKSFYEKITQFFNLAAKYYKKVPDYFDFDTVTKAREIFQPIEQIEKENVLMKKNISIRRHNKKQYYSIFRYIPSLDHEKQYLNIIGEVLNHWSYGTKVYLITSDNRLFDLFKDELEKKIHELGIDSKLKIENKDEEKVLAYNINCYYSNIEFENQFIINDGEKHQLNKYIDELKSLDLACGFNINQYLVEHGQLNDNIVVKAGAGTGKTHTMISRIMFLIHKKKLNQKTLRNSVIMITFTNEAANQMKNKIKKEIENYYILSGDYNYFEMINCIDDMNISTIHSLVLHILQRYSDHIGYGTDLSIVTGIAERRLQLEKSLNHVLVESESNKIVDVLKEFDLTLYHFKKVIEALFKKLENKNIDINKSQLDLDDSNFNDFNNLIKKVLVETENETRKSMKENNTIRLSQLIIELSNLYEYLEGKNELNQEVEYLFIDEFQDTDNIQIDLVEKFSNLFNIKLFIVGDIKQCIYRFRGAEEDAFDRLANKNWTEYALVKNYRTDSLLLDEFDKIFKKWRLLHRLPYEEKDRLVGTKFINNQIDNIFNKIKLDDSSSEIFEQKLVEEIGSLKNKLGNNGSIAILVRENKEAERIVNIGKKYGIEIESENSNSLYKIEPTIDLYKLILALQNNKSPKHLFNLFDSNYINSEIDLRILFQYRGDSDSLYDYIIKEWPIEKWEDYISNIKKDTILKVLRDIIRDLKPWDIYRSKNRMTDRESEYYKHNLDLIFEKLTQRKKTDYLTLNKIQEFLSIMITTSQKEEERSEFHIESSNRIICSTVHKAKGLEFDAVILPFTNLKLADTKKSGEYDFIIFDNERASTIKVGYRINRYHSKMWAKQNNYYKEELEGEKKYRINEEIRILYVALTRAKKYLTMFHYSDNKNEESWQNYLG